MDWSMTWWHWFVVGMVLFGLELLTPGMFFLVFFGVGAVVVGVLAAVGLAGPLWMQIVLFAVLSLASLVTLRRLLVARLRFGDPATRVDRLVGETGRVLEDMAVDGLGKMELRGSMWSARNVGDSPLSRDQRAVVVRVEGLTLWVSGES